MSFKPCKSIEGYILFCSGIHEEAQEDDVNELFSEYGQVKKFRMPQDRKTGSIKGYALIEYSELSEAKEAIKNLNDSEFLGQKIKVDFAFKESMKEKKENIS